MIRSMTGFGEASLQSGSVHYFVEVRSLNSKYFKAVIRLPDDLQALEAEIDAELRRKLTRGSVFVSVHCNDTSAGAAYEINAAVLSRYIDQLQKTPQIASGQMRVDIGPLLALPGVLQPPADEEERLERARKDILTLVNQAADRLLEMRAREGRLLRDELLAHRDEMASKLQTIKERAPASVAAFEERLRQRIDTMLKDAGIALQPVDIIREIAVAAERTDISEEIARLGGHIEQFTELVTSNGGKPVGRTLDFLAQEMLREANTIASKSGDVEIARAIVEIKGAIDRIKEQVQNAE